MNKLENGISIPLTDAEIAEFNAGKLTDAQLTTQKWVGVRMERNSKLQESDWVAARASETGVTVSDDWKTYRQALRDVPSQSDPFNITWPTKPS